MLESEVFSRRQLESLWRRFELCVCVKVSLLWMQWVFDFVKSDVYDIIDLYPSNDVLSDSQFSFMQLNASKLWKKLIQMRSHFMHKFGIIFDDFSFSLSLTHPLSLYIYLQ